MISPTDLARLRSQAEFNAMTLERADWRKLAEALAELEQRREKDKQQETA